MRQRLALATATDAWHVDEDAPALLAALSSHDVDVVPAVWDDPAVDWGGFDLVVVRSTWDYTSRRDQFLAWARRVESVTRLENPARVLTWNTDKHYLGDLAAAGVHVVPTEFLSAAEPASAERAADPFALAVATSRGGDRTDIVVKPTISAGSKDTARYRPGEHGAAAAHALALLDHGRDVMVQPYLDTVDEHGETGMVYFEGRLSHGFRKGPLLREGPAEVDGLFAVEHITPRTPSQAEQELAEQVLSAVGTHVGPGPLLHARIDVLRDSDQRPVLLELELTEPSWFLDRAGGAAERAAEAILSRLER